MALARPCGESSLNCFFMRKREKVGVEVEADLPFKQDLLKRILPKIILTSEPYLVYHIPYRHGITALKNCICVRSEIEVTNRIHISKLLKFVAILLFILKKNTN